MELDAMQIFLQIAEEEKAKQEAIEAEIEAEKNCALRVWLTDRINIDFEPVGGFFWDQIDPQDRGTGAIRMLYQGKIKFVISGNKQSNEITVSVSSSTMYRCYARNDPREFWIMIAGVLRTRYEDYMKEVEKRKRVFWASMDYQKWGIGLLYKADQKIQQAKDALKWLEDDLTPKERVNMDRNLALAEQALEGLQERAQQRRHKQAVEQEKGRRALSRCDIWDQVRKQRLRLVLFYPFSYYHIFYGTGEDDYISAKFPNPVEGDWYDDLNAKSGHTRIPHVVKVEDVMVDDLAGCEYLSFCRHDTSIGVIYTAPSPLDGFNKWHYDPSHGSKLLVEVNLDNGYLWCGEENELHHLPLPLLPGLWHSPYSWLEQMENECQIMTQLDDLAEHLGFFAPETLQEWAAIIKLSPFDRRPFLELCGFDWSESQLPPKMDEWDG